MRLLYSDDGNWNLLNLTEINANEIPGKFLIVISDNHNALVTS